MTSKRNKVGFVVDAYGWAFDHWVDGLIKANKSEFEFFKMKSADAQAMYDRHHFQTVVWLPWNDSAGQLGTEHRIGMIAHDGYRWAFTRDFQDQDIRARAASLWRNMTIFERDRDKFYGFACCNKRIYDHIKELGLKCWLTHPGVDTSIFRPLNFARVGKINKLKAGWCAQIGSDKSNNKGYKEILKPLMRTTDRYVEWSLNTRDASEALSVEEMVNWYNSIDVFVMTASTEGGPLTVLEAAACGVPVLSTNVGVAMESEAIQTFGDYSNPEQAAKVVRKLSESLRHLASNRNTVNMLGAKCMQEAKTKWSWDVVVSEYVEMARECQD